MPRRVFAMRRAADVAHELHRNKRRRGLTTVPVLRVGERLLATCASRRERYHSSFSALVMAVFSTPTGTSLPHSGSPLFLFFFFSHGLNLPVSPPFLVNFCFSTLIYEALIVVSLAVSSSGHASLHPC